MGNLIMFFKLSFHTRNLRILLRVTNFIKTHFSQFNYILIDLVYLIIAFWDHIHSWKVSVMLRSTPPPPPSKERDFFSKLGSYKVYLLQYKSNPLKSCRKRYKIFRCHNRLLLLSALTFACQMIPSYWMTFNGGANT